MPVRPGSRRSCRDTVCAGIVAVGALVLISSPVAAPTDHQTNLVPGPWPVARFVMPYPELPYGLTAQRGGTAGTPVAVLPVALAWLRRVNWLDGYVYQPLPAEPSWDLEEPDRLEVYQDILGFSGIGTPGRDPPPVVQPAPGAARMSTTVLMEVIVKMTAIVFLIAVIMVPAGCAFVAQTLYVNPRDGPQRLDVRAGPVAGAMAYPSLSSCL